MNLNQRMLKRSAAAFLAFAAAAVFLFAAVPVQKAQAAVQKASYTFYVGQTGSFTNYQDVSSVKSSSPSVVSAKKDSSKSYRTNLTAKKAGSAVVTIKTKRGTTAKLTIKVVKPGLSAEIVNVSEETGSVIIKVTNKSALTYERVSVRYSLKNTDGEEKAAATASVRAVVPKSSSYLAVSYSRSSYNVDQNLSSVSVITKGDRMPVYAPDYKYMESGSRLKIQEGTEKDGRIPLTFKNTGGSTLDGSVDYVFYDAEGKIIGVTSKYIYIKAKETDSVSLYTPYKGYDHYDKIVNVYTRTKK